MGPAATVLSRSLTPSNQGLNPIGRRDKHGNYRSQYRNDQRP
jgi:hypothetical protein